MAAVLDGKVEEAEKKTEEKPVEEPKLTAEISLKQMTLKRGVEDFTVARPFFRAVYDAMTAAIQLKEGESKLVELQPKLPSNPNGMPVVGTPEWYKKVAPW